MLRLLFVSLAAIFIFCCPVAASASEAEPVGYIPDFGVMAAFDYPDDESLLIFEATKKDGTSYKFYSHVAGSVWLYIDGVHQSGNGMIFVDGYYYFIRNTGFCLVGEDSFSGQWTGGFVPDGTYSFDHNTGRMIDPPCYPDNWQADWVHDSDIVPDSTLPSMPPNDSPVLDSASFGSIMGMISLSIASASSWFSVVFNSTGMTPVFLSVFFIILALKFLLAPVIGSAGSDKVKKRRSDDE